MNKLDAWIFYSDYTYKSRLKSGYINNLKKLAVEKYNLNIEVMNINSFLIECGNENKVYYNGKIINVFPKIAIMRKNNIFFGRQLELLGVEVINNIQSMVDAKNKLKIHQLLAFNKIPIPKTIYKVSKENYKNLNYNEIKSILGNKFIAKYIFGAKGTNVYLIDNENDFNNVLEKHKGKVIFQEFIESSYGTDLRIYILNGKYKYAAIRKNDNNFKSNLAQGGEALSYEAPQEVIDIAEKTAKICNLDICGVDILIGDNNKYYVCEVNSIPGFESIKKTKNIEDKDILLSVINDKINCGE